MKIVLFCFFGLFIFIRCGKLSDKVKPMITIISPHTKDTIPGVDNEVTMQFTASDNDALTSLILDISDINGINYFADTKQIFGTSYTYKNSFIVSKHSKMKELIMTVHVLDENKNETVVTSDFYLAPKL